ANLIAVMLDRIRAAAPYLSLGDVILDKQLPVAAGIGGGSADAAAVIRAVQALNGAKSDRVNWHGIALALGADVPVCLSSAPQVMRGIGD
ncbi:GHMP family kinase ATP-binding protein, partial [Staphylococcus aureus]